MRIWVFLEDIISLVFLVPKATPEEEQLVGFHLSIPMRYVESSAFFCATTETVKDRTIDTLSLRHNGPAHHHRDLADTKPPQTSAEDAEAKLEANCKWEVLSPHARATSLAHVKIYLDDFISIVQVGPTERRQITGHLFRAIDDLFRHNDKDNIVREEPIFLKKLRKGDATWSTQKIVFGWSIDTVKQVLILPDNCKRNLFSLIYPITPQRQPMILAALAQTTRHPRSTVPAIAGVAGMFTRLQHTLRTAKGRQINLYTPVHAELTLWRHVVASLAPRPIHLREIRPHPPTWIGATDAPSPS